MSASPFRSHLLQQWARGGQGRAPAAVIPWLSQHRSASPELESDQRTKDTDIPCLSISTIDSAADSSGFASRDRGATRLSSFQEGSLPDAITYRSTSSVDNILSKKGLHPTFRPARKSFSTSANNLHTHGVRSEEDEYLPGDRATAFQSILLNRRTATRLKPVKGANPQQEQQKLILALDRAVKCAQMAPNHKHTEPFSFRRFLAGSRTAQKLADISYHVTLGKTNSPPNAESKRQKWLEIPGFLVALVHQNQKALEDTSSTEDLYRALPYRPPETERQLEDYASACAAIQNVLLSLHAEGIGSKWATGPVIETLAFRNLIEASPTDRIAGLIMVGGTTEFENVREEQLTTARRSRRRLMQGDFLVDLD